MTNHEWLQAHGHFTDDQIEQFTERVGNIVDGAILKNPQVEWQARMLALQELRRTLNAKPKALR